MPEEDLELSISRYMSASPERVWRVMSQHTAKWWCPSPWRTEFDTIEWRAGGPFNFTMYGPQGEVIENKGLLLDLVPGQRIVFTDAMSADWQPREPFMIGILEIAVEGEGTRYTGRARHWTKEAMERHREMGFTEGWTAVADQLAALAEEI